jgi:hypothetical protein
MPGTATLDDRIETDHETLADLLAPAGSGAGDHTAGRFDSRPTWDNGKKFDSRPSWDNWDNRNAKKR